MNEVKLSTQVKEKSSRLVVQLDMEALGLSWSEKDTVRVMAYKKDGILTIKKVAKKIKKTICHGLTKTGSGTERLGLYISHKPRRFKKDFKQVSGVSAAVRFLNKEKTALEIYLPKEIYA